MSTSFILILFSVQETHTWKFYDSKELDIYADQTNIAYISLMHFSTIIYAQLIKGVFMEKFIE
jgi:hypothetical protein